MPLPRKAILLIAGLAATLSPPVASAQQADEVTVRLTTFSPWAAPDRPLSVGLQLTNSTGAPLDNVRVGLTIRDRVRSRSALHAALDRQPGGEILAETTEELGRPLAAGESVVMTITRDLGSLAASFRPGVARNGVYPLTIRARAGGQTVAERGGAFVFLAAPPQTRLNIVWVLPLHRRWIDARGAYNKTQLGRDLATGGALRRIVEVLETHQTVPLTLAPTGLLLDQLLDISDGFEAATRGGTVSVPASDAVAVAAGELLGRLKAAVATPVFELASATYARADLTALVAGDMEIDAGRQLVEGRRTVTRLLGRDPNPNVYADGGFRADTRTARTLAALGTRAMVLDGDVLLDPSEGRFGNPDRPEEVRGSGLSFGALLVDPPTRERMETNEDPVLAAMGVLAETAASYFEVPGLAAGRSLVLATALPPSPDVAAPLVDALAQAPWARVRTVSDAVSDPALQPSGEPLRLGVARAEPGDRLTQARAARRAVDLLNQVVAATPERAGDLERLDRLVLMSESADFSRRQSTGSALARSARGIAERTLALISVPARRVTLTARGGRVPVTVINDTGYTIRVRVRLDSPKVSFPQGAVQDVTVDAKRETLTFELEARAAGSFPVAVLLETHGGGDVIGSGQLLVRSTAVSAVTFMATAGGALFLVLAWARRALGRRRKSAATG